MCMCVICACVCVCIVVSDGVKNNVGLHQFCAQSWDCNSRECDNGDSFVYVVVLLG